MFTKFAIALLCAFNFIKSCVLSATLLSTGTLKFVAGTALASSGYYTVSAGGYFSADGHLASNINAAQTVDSATVVAGNGRLISVSPTGAAGSVFTVTGYVDSTKAVVTSILNVTIAASSVAGVASVAKSNIWWSGVSTNNQALTSDVSTGSATTTGNALYLQVALNDAYGVGLTSTTGALTVTASTGANVSIGAAASSNSTSGTYSTAVSSAAPADLVVKVTEATSGAGWAGTVTVTYNGVTMATKSGTISGLATKLTATALVVGHTNTTVDTALAYQAYDAAGNIVVVPVASITLDSSSNTAAVTAVSAGATATSNSATAGTSGYLKVTGGTTAGTSDLVLAYVRTDGVTIKSAPVKFTVGGAADHYTAKLDKSTYAPGDIATLTVSFLDSKGNKAASDSIVYAQTGTSTNNYLWDVTVAAPQLTQIGTLGQFPNATSHTYGIGAAVNTDATATLVWKYTVGTTTGKYNAVVDFPTVDGASGAAQTIAYSITSSDTSLNDVLKGIVDLIASINKQIAALAKLVTASTKKK